MLFLLQKLTNCGIMDPQDEYSTAVAAFVSFRFERKSPCFIVSSK